MTEEANVNELKFSELNEKISNLLKKNNECFASISILKDNISNQNDELAKNAEEIKYYEELIKDKNKDPDYVVTDNEPLMGAPETEEEISPGNRESKNKESQVELVHVNLKEILEEFDTRMKESIQVAEQKKVADPENLFFSAVCVILVEDLFSDIGKPQMKLQTFRISANTTFSILKELCLNLWDMKERTKEFSLRFVDNESLVEIKKENDEIDTYLKSKSNIKKAKFVLTRSNNNKIRFEDIVESESSSKNKNQTTQIKTTSTKILDNFLQRFVGLTQPMLKELARIQHDKYNQNKKEEKKSNKMLYFSKIFANINFLLFFAFTIISLIYMRPTEKTYFMHKALQEKFGKQANSTLDFTNLRDDIISRIQDLFFNTTLMRPAILDTNTPINAIKFSMYRTKKIDCREFANISNCFYPLFSKDTSDFNITNDYISQQIYQNYEVAFPYSDYIDYDIRDKYFVMSAYYNNYITYRTYYDELYVYYINLFDPFIAYYNPKYPILFEGRLGTYDENSAVDLWMSSTFVNIEVFKTFYEIITNKENGDEYNLLDKSMRAFTIDFVIFNNDSEFYFYVHILYEFPSTGGILAPKVTIIPFLINIYEGSSGQTLFILDILRIILNLFMFFFTVYFFLDTKNKLHETDKNMIQYLKIFFDPKMIANILIFTLYIICFATKQINLTQSPQNLIITSINTSTEGEFLSQNKFEYFTIASSFEFVIVIETFIILCLFFRILLLFLNEKRLHVYFMYIYQAAKNVSVFLLIMMMFIFSNAIFSNNLWGQDYDQYRDFEGSMLNILLLSIGHYQKQLTSFSFPIWNIVFILQFFIVVIYFFMTTFVGIYLESYRLNSLENGYSYNYRILRQDDGEVIEKKKKKKVSKEKN